MSYVIGIIVVLLLIGLCAQYKEELAGFLFLVFLGWLIYKFWDEICNVLFWIWDTALWLLPWVIGISIGIFVLLVIAGFVMQKKEEQAEKKSKTDFARNLVQILKLDEKTSKELCEYMALSSTNISKLLSLIQALVKTVSNLDGDISREEDTYSNALNQFISKNEYRGETEQDADEDLSVEDLSVDDLIARIKELGNSLSYHIFDGIIINVAKLDFEFGVEEKKFLDEFKSKTGRVKAIPVVATMSSGKSTLINALISNDLLPSENQACTATVFKIEQHNGLVNPKMRCLKKHTGLSEWEEASQSQLKEWNTEDVLEIEIFTNFLESKNESRHTIIYDTPGPNNSMDTSHAEITNKILGEGNYAEIVVVLNAEQSGIEDEHLFLKNLMEIKAAKKEHLDILFVINKFDSIDLEKEDSISFISNKKKELVELGIKRPLLIPTLAKKALSIRTLLYSPEKVALWSGRNQKELLNTINLLLEQESIYLKILGHDEKNKQMLETVIEKIHDNTKEMNFMLAGENLSINKIKSADLLTGVPLLEAYLSHNDYLSSTS